MKNLIIFLVVLYAYSGIAQKEQKDGPYQEYYKNGQLKQEGFYRNNRKVVAWKDYFDTGQLKRIYSFKNEGQPTGIEKAYYKSGNLLSETKRAKNGDLIKKRFHKNGNLHVAYSLIQSKDKKKFIITGIYQQYYENGVLKIESLYSEGKLSGLWTQYYETGEKEWEVAYLNGYKQGVYKKFYKSGQLMLEGTCFNGFKFGKEKRYDEKGNALWKGSYLKNDFDGKWVQYDSSGIEITTLNYKKGKLKKSRNNYVLKLTDIPDGEIERVPVYPGCENFLSNKEKKDCMSEKLSRFFSDKFNPKIASDLGLTGAQRIYVIFKIDKTGKVIDARAKAPRRELMEEAIRVMNSLPEMSPGMQLGKPVIVPFSLPVILMVRKAPQKNTQFNSNIRQF